MSVRIKICGITTREALQAAAEGGATYVGFVFYPPSSRAVTAEQAARLLESAVSLPSSPPRVGARGGDDANGESFPHLVGLFVNPTDEDVLAVLKTVPLDLIQLHGEETPERVAALRALTQIPLMKALRLGGPEDLANVSAYEDVADWLLFDAMSSKGRGGTGTAFDWSLLQGRTFRKPWMLAGGINTTNLAAAIAATGAEVVDVSSGVEGSPGHKSPAKIRELLALAQSLP